MIFNCQPTIQAISSLRCGIIVFSAPESLKLFGIQRSLKNVLFLEANISLAIPCGLIAEGEELGTWGRGEGHMCVCVCVCV